MPIARCEESFQPVPSVSETPPARIARIAASHDRTEAAKRRLSLGGKTGCHAQSLRDEPLTEAPCITRVAMRTAGTRASAGLEPA